MRELISSLLSVAFGQAKYYTDNLALQDNFSEMKNFLKKIGSNRRLARKTARRSEGRSPEPGD